MGLAWIATAALTLAFLPQVCLGQQQSASQPIQDSSLLVGKHVIVQRTPLCRPNTYTIVLAYAGKSATVISLKPSNVPRMSEATMSNLGPAARALIEDAQRAATFLVEFEDGARLETCGPVGPNELSSYFELAPGESITPSTQGSIDANEASIQNGPAAPSVDSINSAAMLPDEQVRSAINGKGGDHWVWIEDANLLAPLGNQIPSLTLYMPEAVLAIRAASAKKQFLKYEPTDEDRRSSLMVVAEGYAGETIKDGCTSITRIVLLSNQAGGVVKEAYLSEPLEESWRNDFGATNRCQALRAKFSMSDVEEVKAAATNHEFFVAVFSGAVKTKVYKIKKKHQSRMGLP